MVQDVSRVYSADASESVSRNASESARRNVSRSANARANSKAGSSVTLKRELSANESDHESESAPLKNKLFRNHGPIHQSSETYMMMVATHSKHAEQIHAQTNRTDKQKLLRRHFRWM